MPIVPFKTWNEYGNNNQHSPQRRKSTVDLYKIIRLRPKKYSKDDIIKAARLYLTEGSYQKVSDQLGIDRTAIRNWANKDWWPILIEEIKYLKNIELDSKYTNILDRSLREVIERLENGDEVLDAKTGNKYRKKVSARDAALIGAIMYDKRALLRGDPTQIKEHNFNVNDRMDELQSMFDRIAQRSEEKVIEGEAERVVEEINTAVNLPHQNQKLHEEDK